MKKDFKLVWENNPDTPITAQNLSKSFSPYSDEDRILYWDDNDNSLKIKANVKINIVNPVTNAFFTFEDTVVSHNGKFSPIVKSNISYIKDSSIDNSKSIALETGTTNLFVNPSFENGLTQEWGKPVDAGTSIAIDDTGGLFGDKCAVIRTSSSQMSLWQDLSFPSKINYGSFSFYYKADKDFKVSVIDNPEAYANYWRKFAVEADSKFGKWETTEDYAITVIPASNGWKRYEIKSIDTAKSTIIRFKIIAPTDAEIRLDGFQFEEKKYCSAYTDVPVGNAMLSYNNEIVDLNVGSMDIILTEKYLNDSGSNTIFSCNSSTGDAMRLNIENDAGSGKIQLYIYNNITKENIATYISLGENSSFVDKPMRIICNWDKDVGIFLYQKFIDGTAINTAQKLEVFEPKDFESFDIGSRLAQSNPMDPFEGLLDKFKINNRFMSNTDITEGMFSDISVFDNEYGIYENNNYDVVVNESLLDSGTSFSPNTIYYLWIAKNSVDDTAKLYLSLSNKRPDDQSSKISRLFGGFKTDAQAKIDERTIWDSKAGYSNLLVNRFVTFNSTTGVVTSEITDSKTGSSITYNAPITSNSDNVFNGKNTFSSSSEVVINSKASVDTMTFDGGTISTSTGNLNITAIGDVKIVGSAAGKIYLDTICINDSEISSITGDLYFTTPTSSTAKIVFSGAAGATPVELRSNVYVSSGKKIYFDNVHRQFIDLYDATYGIGTDANITYVKTPSLFQVRKSDGTILAMVTDGAESSVVSATSRFYAGRVHNAIYNDLAECWLRDVAYEVFYNQVVVQTAHGVRPSKYRAEKGTVGIVSDSYGFLLNDNGMKEDLKESIKVPIAISGRVKVNSKDALTIGDEVVSYKYGMVVKANWFEKIFLRDRILGRFDSHEKSNTYWIKVY